MAFHQHVFDREKLHVNVARLKKGGHNFEVILEDIDKALECRAGKTVNVREVINGDKVFKDANKGEVVSGDLMKQWFETDDPFKVAEILIRKGELNLSAEQRNRIFENRRKKIVEYIHANAFDPKTKLPHPMQRIELAMKEARVTVDPYDKFDFQIKQIVTKLQPILPMSFERLHLKIIIPTKYAGPAYSAIRSRYELEKEIWGNDGSVQFEMHIIAGIKNDIYSLLNKLTSGEVQIEELR